MSTVPPMTLATMTGVGSMFCGGGGGAGTTHDGSEVSKHTEQHKYRRHILRGVKPHDVGAFTFAIPINEKTFNDDSLTKDMPLSASLSDNNKDTLKT